jgi:hypothetical protein
MHRRRQRQTRFSDIIKGRIDREPPSLVGVPQPSDGVYHVGDEISFTFNQHINCDKLNPVDVLLFDATTNELLTFTSPVLKTRSC